jgi:hypothetical protein
MRVLYFPRLTSLVRLSMARRRKDGAPRELVAVQYGVSVRWLEQQGL